jgi:hypothetical protein
MIAAVPLWEGVGEPFDIVSGTLGAGDGTPPPLLWTVDEFGVAAQINRGNQEGTEWPIGLHDRTFAAPITFFAIVDLFDSGAGGPQGVFSMWAGQVSGSIGLATTSVEAPRMRLGNNAAEAPSSFQGAGPHVWVGFWRADDVAEIRVYNLDGGFVASATDATPLTPPTSGQLTVGTWPDQADAQSAQVSVGYIFGHQLTESEIRQLVADPFGPIRPWRPTPPVDAHIFGGIIIENA